MHNLMTDPRSVGPLSRRASVALALFGAFLYVGGFLALHRIAGDGVVALTVLPVALTGALLGLRAGVLAGSLAFPVNSALLLAVGATGWNWTSGILGSAAVVLIGAAVGRFRDLTNKVEGQFAELVRTQDALRESEQQYRIVAQSAPTGIAIADDKEQLTFVNPAFAEMLGYSQEDLIGMSLSQLTDSQEFNTVLQQTHLRRTGARGRYEITLRTRHGHRRAVLVSASPLTDSDGKYLGGLAVVTDISEMRQAEQELASANKRLERAVRDAEAHAAAAEALSDTASALSATLDLDEVLDRILANVGRVVPHDLADIMLIEDPQASVYVAKAVRGRGYAEKGLNGWLRDLRLTVRDVPSLEMMVASGQPIAVPDTRNYSFWVEFQGAPGVRSYAGAPIRSKGRTTGFLNLTSETPGFYTQAHAERLQAFAAQAAVAIENARLYQQAVQEIEERKRAQAALRQADERLRAVRTGLPIVLFAVDKDGVFTLSEGKGLEALGLEPGQVVGQSAFELYRDVPEIGGSLRRALAGEAFSARIEVGDLVFETWYAPHRGEQGEVMGVIGASADVTERERAEGALRESEKRYRRLAAELEQRVQERTRDLEEAQEALVRKERLAVLGELAGRVSHELRNPLGAIKNSVYYLKMALAGPKDKVGKHLNLMEKEIFRADRILSELLEYARPKTLERSPTHLNQVLEEALGKTAISPGVELSVELDPKLPPLRLDAHLLHGAFENIITNALQAMPSGGRLSLKTELKDGHVVVSFSDTGHGIPKENLECIFTPLFSTRVRGTGLGLSIARNAVEAHGGSVWAESDGESGSTFFVRFPADGGGE